MHTDTLAHDAHAIAFPFDLRWNAQDLADAVPPRLWELVRFDADALAPANQPVVARRAWRQGYAPRAAAPRLFRIQG